MGDELLVVCHAEGPAGTLDGEKGILVLGTSDRVMTERLGKNPLEIFCVNGLCKTSDHKIADKRCLSSSIGGWSGLSISRTHSFKAPSVSPTRSLKFAGKWPYLSECSVSWRSIPDESNQL